MSFPPSERQAPLSVKGIGLLTADGSGALARWLSEKWPSYGKDYAVDWLKCAQLAPAA